MAAVEPLRTQRPDRPRNAPALRLAPRPRPRPTPRRDAVFAATLAVLLAVGIVGVLLLNTAMQAQADHIAAAKQRLSDLTLRAQVLKTTADEVASPTVLAARARQLHLRPATRVTLLRTTPAVSARGPAAPPAPAG
jgi:hypothetical protein